MIRVGDVARIIERFAPPYLALPEDNTGLQIGDFQQPVSAVLVALDPCRGAVRRAVAAGAGLLVSHHPLFHEPIKKFDTTSATGAVVRAALAGGLTIYSAHTNLDAAPRGLSYELARRLGLAEIHFIAPPASSGRSKLVVFVPESAAPAVHRAMAQVGAGLIGRYDSCAFMSPGEGFFRPLAGAKPAIGVKRKLERVREVRLEMVVEDRALDEVLAAMRLAHPYEEAAFDVCPLRSVMTGGLGCVGGIRKVPFAEFVLRVGDVFRAETRVSGNQPTKVDRVAVVPGSGGGLLAEASRQGAQVLVTGEVRYHHMLEAEHFGLGVVELGHDRSEMPAVGMLTEIIRTGLAGRGKAISVRAYKRSPAARPLRASG